MADADDAYDNTHRAFLQALLARQTITFDDVKPLLSAIQTAQSPDRPTLPEDITQEDFEHYMHTINASISPFDLEIRSTLHQTSRTRVYALVNTTSDAITQMATSHSADEIAFVKRVLDAMFEKYNTQQAEVMAVTSMQALKLAKPPNEERRRESRTQTQTAAAQTALTMSQAERVLAQMVQEGWFELSQKGYYTLSPRALMELRGWLEESYNDQPQNENDEDEDDDEAQHVKIKFCQACREIVTMGQRCPDMTCAARVHDRCVRNIFRSQGNREECPICKTAWTNPPPVGEKAAKHAGRHLTNGRRRSTMNEAADDNDVMSGAEDDE